MARNEIKIGADVSSIKRSIFDLSRTIDQSITKKGSAKLFDDETMDFIKQGAKDSVRALTEHMTALKDQASEYSKELQKANISEEESLRIKRKILENTAEIYKAEKEIHEMREASENIEARQRGGIRGGFHQMGRQIQQIPGMQGLGRLLTGGGLGGILRMAPLMAVGFAAVRSKAAFDRYRQDEGGLETSLALRARGVRQPFGLDAQRFADRGFSGREIREAQRQGVDIFGREGVQQSQMFRRAEFARGIGMDLQELQGGLGAIRPQTGFERVNKTFEQFRAEILARGIEQQIGPYFSSMIDLLNNINQDGLGLNNEAISALFTLAGEGRVMSPEHVTRILTGLDEAVRGSQGPRQAFFMEAFGRQGIGSGMLGGTAEAVRMGLFGGDEEQLRKLVEEGLFKQQDLDALRDLKLVGEDVFSQKIAGVLDSIESAMVRAGGENLDPNRRRFLQGRVAAEAFGLPSATEGMRAVTMLERIRDAQTPRERAEAEGKLREFMEDPTGEKAFQDKLTSMFESTEGELISLNKHARNIDEQIARNIAPAMIPIARAMQALTELITFDQRGGIASAIGGTLFDWFGPKRTDDSPIRLGVPEAMDIDPQRVREMEQTQVERLRESAQKQLGKAKDMREMSLTDFAMQQGADSNLSSSELQSRFGRSFEEFNQRLQVQIDAHAENVEMLTLILQELRTSNRQQRKPGVTDVTGSRRGE